MKKFTYLFLIAVLTSLTSFAQQDLTLYELRSAPQAHSLNPSRIPLNRGYLVLPGISGLYVALNSEGFTYSDAFKLNSDKSIDLQLDKAIDKMKDLNNISLDLKVPILGTGFRMGAGYGTVDIKTHISNRFTLPKSLAEFIWLGNGDERFLGKRASFDGLGTDYMQYTEVAFGYARDINEHWTVGAKAKYLSGVAVLKTTDSKLGIHTDANNYALTLDGQLNVQAAGIAGEAIDSILDLKGIDGLDYGQILTESMTGNHGFAFDFGATYRFNEKLSVNASILDLGLINWAVAAVQKNSKPLSYSYEGINVQDWQSNNVDAANMLGAVDTLFKQIDFTEDYQSFSTTLPTKIYAGANYRILSKTDLSAVSFNEIYNGRWRTSFRVAVSQRVRNFFMATMNYSVYGNSAANVGAGFTINAGPVQLYTVTDNVLAYILPEKTKNFHLRFGINFTFENNFSQN